MAKALNAGEVGRIDVQTIYPEHLLFADETNGGRSVPYTQEQIESLAASILEQGQIQPCIGRRVGDNRVQVVAGFGRCKAVQHINTVLRPDKPMKVLIRVMDMNAEEAFVRSVTENLQRAETTPVDDAHAQRRLREDFGWSEGRIAEFYKKSVSYIAQLRKVLVLSNPIKEEIAAGTLPVTTAVVLADLPEEEREQVLTESKGTDGKVDSEVVKKKVRAKKQEKGQAVGLSMKEVRAFFTSLTGPAETEGTKKLADAVLKFLSGRLKEETLAAKINELCKAEAVLSK